MATIIEPTEGTAQVQYQIALSKQKYLNFEPESVSFIEASIQDSVFGRNWAEHTFRSADPAFISGLKNAMTNADPVLLFRLGFGGTNPLWLPWQRHLITDYYSKAQGISDTAGHLIVLKSDSQLTRMRRSNRVLCRKGTISSIVAAIATSNGLESVIEATDGEFSFIQNFIDDTRFIGERLLRRAINKQGKGGYFFFIKDNVLHFHTLDYQGSVKQIDYYTAFSSAFESSDLSQDPRLWDEGISGTRVVVHDPYTGQSKEIISDPAKAVKLADAIYQYSKVENGDWNVPCHLNTNPLTEAYAISQAHYQHARMGTFKTAITLQKTILIRHGDLLNIVLDQQNHRSSDNAGYHYVVATAHTVKKGQVISVYTLQRGETQAQRGTLTTQTANLQLTPETKAPGITPNIIELQSSMKTKGAGNETSATNFVSVADAQTGLISIK